MDIEPLEPALWFVALKKLADRATLMGSKQLESLLRHGYHLLQLAPRQFRNVVKAKLPEAAFEKLLGELEFQLAAEALVGRPADFSLLELSPILFEARVSLPNQAEASVAQASEPAAALLRAWTQCLISLEGRPIRPQSENSHQAQRKARSERHLRLIER